ncbi:hypothetical protein ACHAWF_010151, partial [Thalassiosira exigua]
ESARQWVLWALTTLSGFNVRSVELTRRPTLARRPSQGQGGRIHARITASQTMRAILIMAFPQIVLQLVVVAEPSLRNVRDTSCSSIDGIYFCQVQCKSSAVGLWPTFFSVPLAIVPFVIAYILNIRPKSELGQLPEIVDEKNQLDSALHLFLRTLVICAPMIGLSIGSNAKAYATICLCLSLPISLCYYLAFTKLRSIKGSMKKQRQQRRGAVSTMASTAGADADDRGSADKAVKMAEMYEAIGRVEETIQLVDETLSLWRKGGTVMANIGNKDGREVIGSGFTKDHLKSLDSDELKLIINLLRIKGKALTKVHGQAGHVMSAQLNVDALKIFENCPASSKLKDMSIIFPVFNLVGIQLQADVIAQDDQFSLEVDLAEQFCHEAQVQSFHYARALANLAEIYGRIGHYDEAFKYFEVMRSVYLPIEHPPLLTASYAVDRCAQAMASSALWYMKEGDLEKSIERCDYVIEVVLPRYDKKDLIGLYTVLLFIIRVLKFNGHVARALEVYSNNMPDGAEKHFAVGFLHFPMILLLNICDPQEIYGKDQMATDIDLALEFEANDMTDKIYTCNCWSMNSLGAEICLRLGCRLTAGDPTRKKLLDKGLQLSMIANDRVLAANGMVKHVLAHEAHTQIHSGLLKLAEEDNSASRKVIHDIKADECRSLHTSIAAKTADIAKRLVVTDGSSNGGAGGSHESSNMSAPSTVEVDPKKRVTFSRMSSIGHANSNLRDSASSSGDFGRDSFLDRSSRDNASPIEEE